MSLGISSILTSFCLHWLCQHRHLRMPYTLLQFRSHVKVSEIESLLGGPLLTVSPLSGKASASLLALAAYTHLSLSGILFAPPLILLLLGQPESALASPKTRPLDWRKAAALAGEYVAYVTALALIAALASGGWSWALKTWGTVYGNSCPYLHSFLTVIHRDRLLLPDLTPNPGLWWYFFTEMFDHFRAFFLMVFTVRNDLQNCRDGRLTRFSDAPNNLRRSAMYQIPVSRCSA